MTPLNIMYRKIGVLSNKHVTFYFDLTQEMMTCQTSLRIM